MDIFNLSKVIEKGAFDVMMWILFFPLTILRMIFRPRTTLAYVREEDARAMAEDADDELAFQSAMRPALFLFIAVLIASLMVPLTPEEIMQYKRSEFGKSLLASWLSLTVYNMVIFSMVPLTAAVLLDVLTPGKMTRQTLRRPFDQQCYIGAPSMLVLMTLMATYTMMDISTVVAVALALMLWLGRAEYVFFRDNSTMGRLTCLGLSAMTMVVGTLLVSLATIVTIGVNLEGI